MHINVCFRVVFEVLEVIFLAVVHSLQTLGLIIASTFASSFGIDEVLSSVRWHLEFTTNRRSLFKSVTLRLGNQIFNGKKVREPFTARDLSCGWSEINAIFFFPNDVAFFNGQRTFNACQGASFSSGQVRVDIFSVL